MKIVIPVEEDKTTIAKRTGQCAYFLVYEDGVLHQIIENSHGKAHHHEHQHNHDHEEHTNSHRKDVAQLKGCDVIIVRAVGENMKEALSEIGLEIKKIRQKDATTAQEAVEKFQNGTL